MKFHHCGCGGELVDDLSQPVQYFGPAGEIQILAGVQPQKCARCGAKMPLNLDARIEERAPVF